MDKQVSTVGFIIPASFRSLRVALISALSLGIWYCFDVYYLGREEKFQWLPFHPSYHIALCSMGQTAKIGILPVTKYVYPIYIHEMGE